MVKLRPEVRHALPSVCQHQHSQRAARACARRFQMQPRSGRGFNRTAVEGALARASALWKRLAPKDYPNGAVIFCSEEVAEVVHPLRPLRRRLYSCGRCFDTSVLREMLDAEHGPAYGAIAIDGSEATLGKVQGLGSVSSVGPIVTKLAHLTSTTASRTRRGGQSAARIARNRDKEELEFLRKVAETAGTLFLDTGGLIVAGKADMKRKLLPELSGPLRSHVLCCVDLAGNADMDALRQAAVVAAGAAASCEHRKTDLAIDRFLGLTVMPNSEATFCCYGAVQTAVALKMGAVDELLIAKEYETQDYTTEDWKDLARLHGAQIIEIEPGSEQAVRFCQSFGIGGCLRWPVESSLLEEEDRIGADCAEATLPTSSASCNFADQVDMCSGSTADTSNDSSGPSARGEVLSWLEGEMSKVLDPTTAAALSACVDVILADESTTIQDAMSQVLEVLIAEGLPEEFGKELDRRWQGVAMKPTPASAA